MCVWERISKLLKEHILFISLRSGGIHMFDLIGIIFRFPTGKFLLPDWRKMFVVCGRKEYFIMTFFYMEPGSLFSHPSQHGAAVCSQQPQYIARNWHKKRKQPASSAWRCRNNYHHCISWVWELKKETELSSML